MRLMRSILCLCAMSLCLPGWTAKKPAPSKPGVSSPQIIIRVLILSGSNNHDWKTTTPAIKRILEASGRFIVDITEHPEQCTAQSLALYGAVVSNWNTFGISGVSGWSAATRTAYINYVRRGRGFVVVHAGSSSFYDWSDYQQMSGVTWANGQTGHGAPHSFYVQMSDPGHPITHGMRMFVTKDELWHRTGVQPGLHPLATAYSEKETGGSGQDEPIAFVQPFGRGRTFDLVLGHDTEAMGSLGFQTLLQRGTEWAAIGRVTQPLPCMALNADQLAFALAGLRSWHSGDRREAVWMIEYHVGQVANTPLAASTADKLLGVVTDASATLEGREFACRQLGLIGSSAQVQALIRLLSDKDVGLHAHFALERFPGPEVLAALRGAYSGSTGVERIGIINSLGARRDVLAVPMLAKALSETNQTVAIAAVTALGDIASPDALRILLAHRSTAFKTVRLRALLHCAEQMTLDGRSAMAKMVYEDILSTNADGPTRTAAFAGLLASNPDTSGGMLMKALAGWDRSTRSAAIRALRDDRTGKLLNVALSRFTDLKGEARVTVLNLVESRAVSAALPVVVKAVTGIDTAVRNAAISALGAIGGTEAVPILVKAISTGDVAQRAASHAALTRLKGSGVNAAIVLAIPKSSTAAQKALLSALAARSARETTPQLLALAASNPTLRVDTLTTIGSLGGIDSCAPLLKLLANATDMDRNALQNALSVICSRANSVAPLVKAETKALGAYKVSIIWVLGSVGGTDALNALRSSVKSSVPMVRMATIEALSGWNDASPMDDLLAVAGSVNDTTSKSAALLGVARMAPIVKAERYEHAVEVISKALEIAGTPELRKPLISALGSLPVLSAFRITTKLTDDAAVVNEASLAAMQVADSICLLYPVEVEPVALKLQASPNVSVSAKAAEVLLKLSKGDNLASGGKATNPDGLRADGQAGGPDAAIDGNPVTYWDEEDGKPLYILRVALRARATITVLRITGFQQHSYAPRDFEVVCDDKVVKKMENAQYTANQLVIVIPETVCSTVELRITGYYGQSPAIRELEVYSRLKRSEK